MKIIKIETKNIDTITKLSGTVCCIMCLGCLLKMRTDCRFLETFCLVFFTYKRGLWSRYMYFFITHWLSVFTVLKIMWQYQLLTLSEELWCGVRRCQLWWSVVLLLAETTLWPVTNCCKFTEHNSPCVAVPQYNWLDGDSIIVLVCYTVWHSRTYDSQQLALSDSSTWFSIAANWTAFQDWTTIEPPFETMWLPFSLLTYVLVHVNISLFLLDTRFSFLLDNRTCANANTLLGTVIKVLIISMYFVAVYYQGINPLFHIAYVFLLKILSLNSIVTQFY